MNNLYKFFINKNKFCDNQNCLIIAQKHALQLLILGMKFLTYEISFFYYVQHLLQLKVFFFIIKKGMIKLY